MVTWKQLKQLDRPLIAAVCVLCFMGLAFIWSSSTVLTDDGIVHSSSLLNRQIVWMLVGALAAGVVLAFDYNLFSKLSYVLYGLGMLSLLFVLAFVGQKRGVQRWIPIGPFQLQPSEFMKIAVVLALARYLMFRRNYRTLTGLIPPFLIVLVPMGLIIMQPDLGTASVLLPALFAMLYAAGARIKHLLITIAAGIASLPVMWYTVMTYQRDRILAFLAPARDPSGAGYQTIQSLIALGHGGWTGQGFGEGAQNLLNSVPAAHTDFIFAVIAEEWGLLGGLMVLTLFFILFTRGVDVAGKTKEPFGRLVVVGGVTILAFQTLVNIGMTMRLCPVTGVTLPFISYGGSSLLSSFIIIALILSVGMRRKQVIAPDDFEG